MEVGPRLPEHANNMASCMRKFTKMNPPMLFGWKTDEDLQDFINELYKILYSIGMTSIEKAELVGFQLKDVTQIQYM